MYTINFLGLGQTSFRPMALQKAVTFVLTAAEGVTAFPGELLVISAAKFDGLVTLIVKKANEGNWIPRFTESEAARDMQQRGYRRGVFSTTPIDFTPQPPINDPVPLLFSDQPAANLVLPDRPRLPGTVQLPVIIPPSTLPDVPPLPVEKKSNAIFWIAGILALYVLGAGSASPIRSSARSRRKKSVSGLSGLGGLAGEFANCAIWQEVESKKTGGLIWRCLKQGPACSGKSCKAPGKKRRLRTCTQTKQVPTTSSKFKRSTVTRCSKYQKVCTTGTCLPEAFQKGAPSPGHGLNVNRMVRDMARQMADDRTIAEETAGKALGQEIMDRGGIRSYRGRSRSGKRVLGGEEFAVVPIFMRRKEGLPLDEMASEMGFDTDTELLEAIRREYPKIHGKKKRVFIADDFMKEAESHVWTAIDAGMVGSLGLGQGQDLFPGLKRELVLKTDDPATSDDPLGIFLQRKGWELPRVRELQASISDKAVPDMFTGKTGKLTAGEVELQRDIDEFLKDAIPMSTKVIKARREGDPKYADRDPFWIDQPVQQHLFGLGGLSTEKIAEGVRKAVKQDARRKAHGDTSMNAFFIGPDLTIYPWNKRQGMKAWAGNVSVHSHSAENFNYLRQLTGKPEPAMRFSKIDIRNFRDRMAMGTSEDTALIMGDGRMVVLRCPADVETLTHVQRKNITKSIQLPSGWREKKQYQGMNYNEAMRDLQKRYLERRHCAWTDARWKERDVQQPMLFKTLPSSQKDFIQTYMRDPVEEYTPGKRTRKGREAKADLTKEFWTKVDPRLYTGEPTQQELFTMRQRHKRATTGAKKITMGPGSKPQQLWLLGG